MTEEIKKEDEELKMTEQRDGSVVVGDEPPEVDAGHVDDEDDEDDKLVTSDDSEEGDHPDDSEEKRERNRKRRAESKVRRKEAMDSLKRELASRDRVINELSGRLSTVERKSTGGEMAQLDRAEQEAVQAYNHFKQINAQAIEQANGAVAIDAQERMYAMRQRYEQIQGIKKAISQKQNAPQPLDPRLANHAQKWMDSNKWYDPSGRDADSSIMLTIDKSMAEEGWNPTTEEYWKELSARRNKYLPHRASAGYNKSQDAGKRSTPPVAGSGRESSGTGTTTYRLSAERVQSLKDAGLWDDPKSRAEAVKRYQAYDKEQQA